MLKKRIKYTDFNGNPRDEDFYFNLTKAEIARLQYSENGGLAERIKGIARSHDNNEILRLFEEIILMSYGKKSEDGRRFMKGEEISKEFLESPAYDELYFELVGDAEKFADFVNGLIPPDLAKEVERMKASGEIPELTD